MIMMTTTEENDNGNDDNVDDTNDNDDDKYDTDFHSDGNDNNNRSDIAWWYAGLKWMQLKKTTIQDSTFRHSYLVSLSRVI